MTIATPQQVARDYQEQARVMVQDLCDSYGIDIATELADRITTALEARDERIKELEQKLRDAVMVIDVATDGDTTAAARFAKQIAKSAREDERERITQAVTAIDIHPRGFKVQTAEQFRDKALAAIATEPEQ